MGLDIANIVLRTPRKFVSNCALVLLKSSCFLLHQSDDVVVGSHTYFWSCFRVVYKSSTKCFEGENKMRKLSPTYNTSTLQNTLILILYVHATVRTVCMCIVCALECLCFSKRSAYCQLWTKPCTPSRSRGGAATYVKSICESDTFTAVTGMTTFGDTIC